MTPARKRNLWRAPVVLLVRVPLLLPLCMLALLGERAEWLARWIGRRLPVFENEPRRTPRS